MSSSWVDEASDIINILSVFLDSSLYVPISFLLLSLSFSVSLELKLLLLLPVSLHGSFKIGRSFAYFPLENKD